MTSEEPRSLLGSFRLLPIDEELVFEFFLYFSRFEYALKRAGYVTGNESRASADWNRFASSLEGDSLGVTSKLIEAKTYLLDRPPKKQFLQDGEIRWKECESNGRDSEVRYLIDLINIVRNNLFHGGKYPEGPISDPVRDQRLLESCLVILKECLELNPNVKDHFFQGIE